MFFMNCTGSAEILPFIKTYLVTPAMLVFVYLYVKISKKLNVYKRFNVVIFYFLIVIGSCYYFFIPNLDSLRLDALADSLEASMPGMKHLWETIRFWPLSILYIHADVWSSLMLGIAFWTLANETTSFNTAQRIYSYLTAIGSAVGSLAAGVILKNSFAIRENFNHGLLIVTLSIIAMAIVYNIMLVQLKHLSSANVKIIAKDPEKKKKKLSFIKSIKVLANSKHLTYIAAIVLCFNLFINLFEAVWKDQVAQYGRLLGKGALASIYGEQSMYIGILVLLFGILAPFIKSRGWKFTASTTPYIAVAATSAFCIFMFSNDFFIAYFHNPNNEAYFTLKLSVVFGLLNLVFIQASKYVLFDSTKEQAYIPLTDEEKIDGKAAIDGVGSRLGKSLGGVILSWPIIGLIHVFGSISNARFYICAIMFIILWLWIKSIKKLDFSIKNKLSNEENS